MNQFGVKQISRFRNSNENKRHINSTNNPNMKRNYSISKSSCTKPNDATNDFFEDEPIKIQRTKLNPKLNYESMKVDESIISDDDKHEVYEDEIFEQEQRSSKINRFLHNHRVYFEQKNNLDCEISDIQSECDLDSVTFGEKMQNMISMFIQSFVPFNLLHSSYFTNLLRDTYKIRRMPKLVQMENLFNTMYELAIKYNRQTLAGAHSYTLIFEFWKSSDRRHQFINVRASYIDVFVRRSPVLTCFKVFHDWSSERYIDKFNFIFKKFNLDREKVFAVVTNLKAKNFLTAIDMYIGSDKIIFCLIHQLNLKFNELFLDYDYEEDKIHYEKQLKELKYNMMNNSCDENLNDFKSSEENDSLGDIERFGSDDFSDDDHIKIKSNSLDDECANRDQVYKSTQSNIEDQIDEISEEYKEEFKNFNDKMLAYVKLIEEPEDVFKFLNKQKIQMNPAVRIIKSLLKTFAYISSDEKLLEELNCITRVKNGYQFDIYYLLAYKNWNYLRKLLLYFKMVKGDALEFFAKYRRIPFDLNQHDLQIIDDLFDVLACLVKRMNLLSLAEELSLGKTLNILKSFINNLESLKIKTEEGKELKHRIIDSITIKLRVFERDQFYGIASVVHPKCTNLDFKDEKTFKEAINNLHDNLCFRLDKNFNIALFKIRYPLKIEIENFHKKRPFKDGNSIAKFQQNSPVFQNLLYDYFTIPTICFEPKMIDFEVREEIVHYLTQIRRDTLDKVILLNSLDHDVLNKLIDCCKFW